MAQSLTPTPQQQFERAQGLHVWTLAIDPGETTGGALFSYQNLVWSGLLSLDGPRWPWGNWNPDRLVIEIPNAHESKGLDRAKRDPQAIITLAITAGQWIRHVNARDTVRLFPSTWKGQVPKKIHNARVCQCLQLPERGTVPALPESKLHNVIDAIGLGLFNLGRMARGRAA